MNLNLNVINNISKRQTESQHKRTINHKSNFQLVNHEKIHQNDLI